MFSEFSRGYYLGRLWVEPHDGDRAAVHRDLQERVNEQLYGDDEGLSRLDAPLVVKLDNHHFAVHGEAGVPEDTLAVPDHVVGDGDNPPALREILLAKADRAAQLLRLSGQMDDPDGQVGI
jgi:hypothetical protein